MDNFYDTIVVGGGISGLTSALILKILFSGFPDLRRM